MKILIYTFSLLYLSILVHSSELSESPRRKIDNSKIIFALDRHRTTKEETAYTYAICQKWNYPLIIDCNTYQEDSGKFFNTKNFTLIGSDNRLFNKDIQIISIVEYGIGRLLVKWLEIENKIVINGRYTIVDLLVDKMHHLIFPIGLSPDDPNYLNEATFESALFFDISVSSKSVCEISDKCRLTYKGDGTDIIKRIPLNINLMHVKFPLRADKNLYVMGKNPDNENYTIIHLNNHNNRQDLITFNPKTEFVSSIEDQTYGLSFCQVETRTSRATIVNCIKWYNTEISINKTFVIQAPVKLINVISLKKYVSGILLLTEDINCVGYKCWNLYATIINEDVKVREVKFNCVGERKNLVIHYINNDGQDKLAYGCEKSDFVRFGDAEENYFHVDLVNLNNISYH